LSEYEARYVIVAGVAWLRCTRGTPAGTAALWLTTFDGEPVVRKTAIPLDMFGDVPLTGEVDGVAWELEVEELAPAFRTPHRAVRRLTPSGIETWPALRVRGRVGDRSFDDTPGHRARLWGRGYPKSWGWAHGSTLDGRWVHLLTARVGGLPPLSQHASERGGPSLPFARASVAPGRVRVGPYVAEAPPESFVEVEYADPDGTPVRCLHSEQGRIGDLRNVAIELGGAAA
jgi:hypothetical protein